MSLLINGVEMPKDYKQLSATLDRQIDDGILRLFVYDFDSEAAFMRILFFVLQH